MDRYLDLAEAADGDPGMAATLTELADYVAGLVAEIDRSRPSSPAASQEWSRWR